MSAATSYFSSRTKAVDRVGRIRSDMDRSSAYILGSSSSSTSDPLSKYRSSVSVDPVKFRARRDSSLGASFRSGTSSARRDSSYAPTSPIVSRRRESSIATMTPTLTRRGSAIITPVSGLGSETAKYNREQSIQEIKSQFDKQFQETQKKMRVNVTGSDDVGEERMNKARAKILGTATSATNAWDNQFSKRNCLSEMYTEMKRFSTKTVAAINSVADCDFSKRKEDYNWRKDLESYEKSREFERDLRTRSIEGNRRRREQKENELNYQNNKSSSSNSSSSNNRRSSSTSTVESQAKRPPLAPTTITSNNNNSNTDSNNNNSSSSGGGRKSWRDRFNEKQEQQKKKVMEEFSAEAEDRAKKLVASQMDTPSLSTKASDVQSPSPAKATAAKKTSSNSNSSSSDLASESTATTTAAATAAKPVSEVAKKRAAARKAAAASKVKENSSGSSSNAENGEEGKVTAAKDQQESADSKDGEAAAEEDEDVHGTRKMKSDFDSMMSNLDQEMEAGRSKLAKLREKIRRTKANIKAADEAEAAEDAKRAKAS